MDLRAPGRILRIGHKGAAALVPENTLHSLQRAVFAWTVDRPADLGRVVVAGMDGVITNDPRIFGDTLWKS